MCGGRGALGPNSPKKLTAILGTEPLPSALTESRLEGAKRSDGFWQNRTGSSEGEREKPTRGRSGRRHSSNRTARKKSKRYGFFCRPPIRGSGVFPCVSAIE